MNTFISTMVYTNKKKKSVSMWRKRWKMWMYVGSATRISSFPHHQMTISQTITIPKKSLLSKSQGQWLVIFINKATLKQFIWRHHVVRIKDNITKQPFFYTTNRSQTNLTKNKKLPMHTFHTIHCYCYYNIYTLCTIKENPSIVTVH